MDIQTSAKSTQASLGAWMSRGIGPEQRGFGCHVELVLNSGDCVNPRVRITRGNPNPRKDTQRVRVVTLMFGLIVKGDVTLG